MLQTTLLAIAMLLSTPALAVHKCTINGRTTFQDSPCPDAGKTVQEELSDRAERKKYAERYELQKAIKECQSTAAKYRIPRGRGFASSLSEASEVTEGLLEFAFMLIACDDFASAELGEDDRGKFKRFTMKADNWRRLRVVYVRDGRVDKLER